jgi:hypothetical protein
MPDDVHDDANDVSQNKGKKALKDSDWDDSPTIKQAQKPSPTAMSQPKQMGSDPFSKRRQADVDQSKDFEDSLFPESDRAQPQSRDDEDGPKRQGPAISDMARQHSNGKMAYMSAKEDQYSQDMAEDDMKKVQSPLGRYAEGGIAEAIRRKRMMAEGGMPDMEPDDSGMELMERDDERDMERKLSPAPLGQPKSELDESHDYGDLSGDPDMESEHSNGRRPYAMGGEAGDDSEMQPHEEAMMEHATSIAAAIMAKRDRMKDMSSGASDEPIDAYAEGGEAMNPKLDQSHRMPMKPKKMKMYAKGGVVDGQVDLQDNSNEHLNEEDQLSFKAPRKDTYYDDSQISPQPLASNEHGRVLPLADQHGLSLVDEIRRRMKMKQMKE